MGTAVHTLVEMGNGYHLTRHAWERMSGRGVSPDSVRKVIQYGRVTYTRGAVTFVVGANEVKRFLTEGVDLSKLEGIHVVCSDQAVITVYKNRNLRGLRPARRRNRSFA